MLSSCWLIGAYFLAVSSHKCWRLNTSVYGNLNRPLFCALLYMHRCTLVVVVGPAQQPQAPPSPCTLTWTVRRMSSRGSCFPPPPPRRSLTSGNTPLRILITANFDYYLFSIGSRNSANLFFIFFRLFLFHLVFISS